MQAQLDRLICFFQAVLDLPALLGVQVERFFFVMDGMPGQKFTHGRFQRFHSAIIRGNKDQHVLVQALGVAPALQNRSVPSFLRHCHHCAVCMSHLAAAPRYAPGLRRPRRRCQGEPHGRRQTLGFWALSSTAPPSLPATSSTGMPWARSWARRFTVGRVSYQ